MRGQLRDSLSWTNCSNDEALQQKQRHEQYVANKDATLGRAAELLGYHRTERDRSSFSIYGGSGKIYLQLESYGETDIKLELHGLIGRLAPTLKALRRAMEAEQEEMKTRDVSNSTSTPQLEMSMS